MSNLQKEKAILIGVNINKWHNFNASMDELKNLAISCDYEVIGQLEQNLKEANRSFYIGSGKIDEIKALADRADADLIIFNNELTPSQLSNLVKALKYRVLDRTSLILEIFVKRAKTKEAKLQVEMAKLQYMLPRLIGINESLAQQKGGVGSKTRGSGEKALELDRRRLERKLYELNKELNILSNRRTIQRKKRSKGELPIVALVGYTNSGKSTLMNTLLDISGKPEHKKVVEKDMLFATLDTSVRKIEKTGYPAFLLADTVGFIDNLPHDLVKAFRSTLEEVRMADLLLHIIDISNPDYEGQIKITENTLQEIGAGNISVIYVFNKIDTESEFQAKAVNNKVFISARKKIGLELLLDLIYKELFNKYIECLMFVPYNQGKLLSYLNSNAYIKTFSHEEKGVLLDLRCLKSDYKKFYEFVYNK